MMDAVIRMTHRFN